MSMFVQSHAGQGLHNGYKGAIALSALLWLILSLSGCFSSRTEYVVDYTRGNDSTAEGSRKRPCQTEVQCHTLAERDGVQSYWLVYQ